MFDVGFSELIVIGIVALVVIGPERLPKVARTAGHLLGRFRRYVDDVKADINREMQLDELRKLQAEMQESARNLEASLSKEVQSVEQAVQQAVQPESAPAQALADTTPAASDSAPAVPAPVGAAAADANATSKASVSHG